MGKKRYDGLATRLQVHTCTKCGRTTPTTHPAARPSISFARRPWLGDGHGVAVCVAPTQAAPSAGGVAS
jgi:hypothetical protein